MKLVVLAFYFPPINSSGAKRFEAIAKHMVAHGHQVTVITPTKRAPASEFTESVPAGVRLIELDRMGRCSPSRATSGRASDVMFTRRPSLVRRLKDLIFAISGQVIDPRLIFAANVVSPFLDREAKDVLRTADVVIGTCPPYPILLAALLAKWRFGPPCILDYRDQFSECHEMPGSRAAKLVEKLIDKRLVGAADQLVVVSEPMRKYYEQLGSTRVEVIMNGYDNELLAEARRAARDLVRHDTQLVVIRYLGIVSPGRVPRQLLEALALLWMEDPLRAARVSIEFYGASDPVQEAIDSMYPVVAPLVKRYPTVPYREALTKMAEADFLLISESSDRSTLSAQGILTTKLFEYIGAGRPIIANIAKDTLIGETVSRQSAFSLVSDETHDFLTFLRSDALFERRESVPTNESFCFSRESQALQYIDLAKSLISTPTQ